MCTKKDDNNIVKNGAPKELWWECISKEAENDLLKKKSLAFLCNSFAFP